MQLKPPAQAGGLFVESFRLSICQVFQPLNLSSCCFRPSCGNSLGEPRISLQLKVEPIIFVSEADHRTDGATVFSEDDILARGLLQQASQLAGSISQRHLKHHLAPH